jgi:preprotein translocase subunit Sss1
MVRFFRLFVFGFLGLIGFLIFLLTPGIEFDLGSFQAT